MIFSDDEDHQKEYNIDNFNYSSKNVNNMQNTDNNNVNGNRLKQRINWKKVQVQNINHYSKTYTKTKNSNENLTSTGSLASNLSKIKENQIIEKNTNINSNKSKNKKTSNANKYNFRKLLNTNYYKRLKQKMYFEDEDGLGYFKMQKGYKKEKNTSESQSDTSYINEQDKLLNTNNNKSCNINYNKCKQYNSLYKYLADQKSNIINNVYHLEPYTKKNTKNIVINRRPCTPKIFKDSLRTLTTDKITRDSLPKNKLKFQSITEEDRYYKNMISLLELRENIQSKIKDNLDYVPLVKNFLYANGIIENMYFVNEKLKNFMSYLDSDFIVDPNIEFKKQLINVLNTGSLNIHRKKESYNPIFGDIDYTDYFRRKFNKPKNKVYFKPVKKSEIVYPDIKTNLRLQNVTIKNYTVNEGRFNFKNKCNEISNSLGNEFTLLNYSSNYNIKNNNSNNSNNQCVNDTKNIDPQIYDSFKTKGKLLELICLKKALRNEQLKKITKKINSDGLK